MYFAKFPELLFANIYVPQLFLIASFGMQFQTVPSQVALSSVFRLALKILGSTFNFLYLFECIFQVVFKMIFMFLLSEDHFTENKKSKWNNYCSLRVRKSLFHIILEREHWKLLNQLLARRGLKKAQKGWLCGHWKAVSFKLYPPLCMYYRTLLEWFLTEFLQSKYVWLCFY